MKNRKKMKPKSHSSEENIRFIVPMPGKSNWKVPENEVSLKRLHKFTHRAGDLALEDFQAQFLMQREYFID